MYRIWSVFDSVKGDYVFESRHAAMMWLDSHASLQSFLEAEGLSLDDLIASGDINVYQIEIVREKDLS